MAELFIARDYPEVTYGDRARQSREALQITINDLEIDPDDYLLIGGASLVLRGIIADTPDIDMLVSDKGFGVLAQKLDATLHNPPVRAILQGARNRSVHVMHKEVPVTAAASMGNGYYPISFTEHRPKAEFIYGVPCMDIEDVISSKTALARENDIRHLELISDFLGRAIVVPPQRTVRPLDSPGF
jgi:hypothetical protein